MNRSGIILHPKYGLNPTLCTCFWCGDDTGEIALLGISSRAVTGRDEAPMHMVMSYEPCDKCKENMAKGITFIEAQRKPVRSGQQPIQDGEYPTGKWWVITEEAAGRLEEPMRSRVLEYRHALIEPEAAEMLGFYQKEDEMKTSVALGDKMRKMDFRTFKALKKALEQAKDEGKQHFDFQFEEGETDTLFVSYVESAIRYLESQA